jgi:hypothetical protein
MAPINLGTAVTSDTDADGFRALSAVAILAGQECFEAANGTVQLASDAADLFGRRRGIAMNSAPTAGQEVFVQTTGRVKNTATLVKGSGYYSSDTPGSLGSQETAAPDIGTGDWINFTGIADTTTSLRLRPFSASVQHA